MNHKHFYDSLDLHEAATSNMQDFFFLDFLDLSLEGDARGGGGTSSCFVVCFGIVCRIVFFLSFFVM